MTNTLSTNSSAIPMPLSETVNSHSSRVSDGSQSTTIRAVTPSRRNFTALPIRFCHNIVSSIGSPSTCGSGESGSDDLGPGFLDRGGDVAQCRIQHAVQGDVGLGGVQPSDPGEHQQVVDEHLHAFGAVDREADVFRAAGVQFVAVPLLQQLAERGHLAQGLLQIVRRDVGELFEFGIGAPQLDGLLVEGLSLIGQGQLRGPRLGEFGHDALPHVLDVSPDRANVSGPLRDDVLLEVAPADTPARRGECLQRPGDGASDHDRQQNRGGDEHQQNRDQQPVAPVLRVLEFGEAVGPDRGQMVVLSVEKLTDTVEFDLAAFCGGAVGDEGVARR